MLVRFDVLQRFCLVHESINIIHRPDKMIDTLIAVFLGKYSLSDSDSIRVDFTIERRQITLWAALRTVHAILA